MKTAAAGLNGDLVDVARSQTGATELREARAALSELMQRSIDSVRTVVSERQQSLSISVSPEVVYLNLDLPRIAQALHHIIGNASKFTDKHGHIHIWAQRVGAHAVIVVRDTGIGIPPLELEKIFGLFDRIDGHGGTASAASDGASRGTVFTVRLPCEVPIVQTVESAYAARAGDPILA